MMNSRLAKYKNENKIAGSSENTITLLCKPIKELDTAVIK